MNCFECGTLDVDGTIKYCGDNQNGFLVTCPPDEWCVKILNLENANPHLATVRSCLFDEKSWNVGTPGCYEQDIPAVGRARAVFCDTDWCNGGPVGNGTSCTELPNSSLGSKSQTLNSYYQFLICTALALLGIISTTSYF